MALDSILDISLDEKQWIVQITTILQTSELESIVKTPVSISQLPDSITKDKPEAYIPRRVGLGPYHHLCHVLYHMEVYKLDKAKSSQNKFKLPEFPQLVHDLKQQELKIRACYHKYLEIEGETLAWIMVIDSLYLLWLLSISSDMVESGRNCDEVPFSFCKEQESYTKTGKFLMDNYGIEKDVLLLENQIPMNVLKEILSRESHGNLLTSLLFNYCASVSPFELESECLNNTVFDHSQHLLHFLYDLILIPKERIVIGDAYLRMGQMGETIDFVTKCLNILASTLNIGFIQVFNEFITTLLTMLKLLPSTMTSSSVDESRVVPPATELRKAKVEFKPTWVGIKDTGFSKTTKITITLPVISLNGFSEVILRNLVAFEITSKLCNCPPFLARYVSLMNGLIATVKDVKLLQEAKIINNQLGSDDEVVKLFSGIWKSVNQIEDNSTVNNGEDESEARDSKPWEGGLLEVPHGQAETISKEVLGKKINVIEDINQYYYNTSGKGKSKKFMKKYVYPSVKIASILVIILLGILLLIHTLCSFFSCPNVFRVSKGLRSGQSLLTDM